MSLSPEIEALIQRMQANRGFELRWLNRGIALKLVTKHSTYTAIVASSVAGELVLYCPESDQEAFHRPTIYALQGSTVGGSAVQVGWIGIGARLRLNMLGGGIILLSELIDIQFVEASAETKRLLVAAEAHKPSVATPAELEQMKAEAEKWFKETFAGSELEEVLKIIHEFCFPNGQLVIATLLSVAKEHGKFAEAIARVKKDLDDHWSYRVPSVRGEFITQADVDCIDAAYADLGLPNPSRA